MNTLEEITPCGSSGWRESHHQLWTAMQTAHEDYRRASHLLQILASHGSDLTPGNPGAVDLEMVKDKQRDAFEAYIDTRLRFSEFSTQSTREPDPVNVKSRFNAVWVQMAVAAALLLSAAVHSYSSRREVTYLNSERSQLAAERSQLTSERRQLASERSQLTSERSQLASEFEQARASVSALSQRLKALQDNHPVVSWRRPSPATVSSQLGSSSTRKLVENRVGKNRAHGGPAIRRPSGAGGASRQYSSTGAF